jgi:hypothetical protein
MLVAGIEMLLSEIVKFVITEEDIVARMQPRVRERYEQAHKANSEAHPVEYLYIGQLVKLFFATSYRKDSRLWNEPSTQRLVAVQKFRNSVMHPVRSIAATTTPSRAAELASWAEEIAERLRQMVIMLRAPSNR